MNPRVDRFLFAPVDTRMAAWFRRAFAIALAVMFWPEGRAFVSPVGDGAFARALWSSVFLTRPWWGLCLVVLAAWGVGLGGRRMGWLALLVLLPLWFSYGVTESRQILLLSLLAFSLLRVDRDRSSAGPMWPIRLVQLQLSLTYLVNAAVKTTPTYLSGDVLVALSRTQPNFLVDLTDGMQLVGSVVLPAWVAAVGTVVIEYALALLWWFPRMRIPAALLGVTFHLSLEAVIEVGWLDWACIFLYLAFLLPFESAGPSEPGDGRETSQSGDLRPEPSTRTLMRARRSRPCTCRVACGGCRRLARRRSARSALPGARAPCGCARVRRRGEERRTRSER